MCSQTQLIVDALLFRCFAGTLQKTFAAERITHASYYFHTDSESAPRSGSVSAPYIDKEGDAYVSFLLLPAHPLKERMLRIQRQFQYPPAKEQDALRSLGQQVQDSTKLFRNQRPYRRIRSNGGRKVVLCMTDDTKWVWLVDNYWWKWYFYFRNSFLGGFHLHMNGNEGRLRHWCFTLARGKLLEAIDPIETLCKIYPFKSWQAMVEQIYATAPFLPPSLWEHNLWTTWWAKRIQQESTIPAYLYPM